jgi:hypothetical protein
MVFLRYGKLLPAPSAMVVALHKGTAIAPDKGCNNFYGVLIKEIRRHIGIF